MSIFKDTGTLSAKKAKQTGLQDEELYSEFEEYGINLTGSTGQRYYEDFKADNYNEVIRENEALKEELFGNSDGSKPAGSVKKSRKDKKAEKAAKKEQDAIKKAAKQVKKKSKGRKVKRIILAILLILVVFVGYLFSLLGRINKDDIDESALGIVDVPGYTNILILGVDSRDMESTEGARTDMIMIASINDSTKEVTLTSVFRDTYLRMGATEDYDKITHAHAYGGPEMTIRSLNDAMDLDIDDYVLVNFKGVADAIDALGGIEIDVEDYEIEQLNKYAKETAKVIGRDGFDSEVTEPGLQTLDGCQAVSYGRIRKGVGDDFKRTERMRIVLQTVADELKTMNIIKLTRFAGALMPEIKTDIGTVDIMKYIFMLKSMDFSGSEGFPYNPMTGTRNGASCVFAIDLESDVIEMHEKVFGQADYDPTETCKEISYYASYY